MSSESKEKQKPFSRENQAALLSNPALPLWLFFGFLIGQLFIALWPTWNDGTYYDYGLIVPILVPFLFSLRWKEASSGISDLGERVVCLVDSLPVWLAGIFVVLMTIPLRLVETVDSSWRAPLYLHAFLVLSFIFLCLLIVFGLRKTCLFIPCAITVIIAVPQPSGLESSLIRELTSWIVDLSVMMTRLTGIPVTSSGETIFANGIPLQVSEGCSGIRSFQSSIFAAFVIGEFLRLTVGSRLFVVIGGLATAFALNWARVMYLVQYAASNPDNDIQKAHDISGYFSLGITFAIIFLVSSWIKRLEGKFLA